MEHINIDGYQICHGNWNSILREKRVILGLTQQQVADKAGVALIQYQRFERGERNIMTASFRIACRIIKVLEMNIDDFYSGEYAFGEKIMSSPEGLKYMKTGKLINEDVE